VGEHLVPPRPPLALRWGGMSGIGREGGEYSMRFYSEPTNVCIQLSEPTPGVGGVQLADRGHRG
jgi:hypothetical protein